MPITQQPLAIILDFDGTVTLRDVGALIVETFGRDGWQSAEAAYERGEISLRELWTAEVSHLRREDHETIRRSAVEMAEVRPGLKDLLDFCRAGNIPVEVASSGIRFYIDAILESAGVTDLPVAAPDADYDGEGNGLITFQDSVMDCGMTAMCKCERVWEQRRQGRRVLFVGDGDSDYCAASQADFVMATGRLARHCERNGTEFTPFDDFFDVKSLVEALAVS